MRIVETLAADSSSLVISANCMAFATPSQLLRHIADHARGNIPRRVSHNNNDDHDDDEEDDEDEEPETLASDRAADRSRATQSSDDIEAAITDLRTAVGSMRAKPLLIVLDEIDSLLAPTEGRHGASLTSTPAATPPRRGSVRSRSTSSSSSAGAAAASPSSSSGVAPGVRALHALLEVHSGSVTRRLRVGHTDAPGVPTVVVIGVANTVALPERYLPQLRLTGREPRQVVFSPYSAAQIAHLLRTRITSDPSSDPVVPESVLDMCARRVAASSGDMRRALELLERTLQSARDRSSAEISRKRPRSPSASDDDPDDDHSSASKRLLQSPPTTTTTATASSSLGPVKASLVDVMSAVRGGARSRTADVVASLPFQAQALLIAALRGSATTGLTVGRLQASFGSLVQRKLLARLSSSEFHDLLIRLQEVGLVAIGAARPASGARAAIAADRSVRLYANRDDVVSALQDSTLLALLSQPGS